MDEVLWEGDYSRYVSFKGTDSKLRLGMLHSNNMVNVEGKFKVLKKVNKNDVISIGKQKFWLRVFLLDVKVKGTRLFAAVEQGGGKYSDDIMIIVSSRAKIQARKWIAEQYSKIIEIYRNCEYKTSFSPFIEETNDEYNTGLKQFVQRLFK